MAPMPRDDDEGEGRRRALRGRRRRQPAAEVDDAAARALVAWADLCDGSMLRRGGGQLLVMDGPGDSAGICPLRPLAQVLAARLELDRLGVDAAMPPGSPTVDDLADTLELYRWGEGYADFPGTDAVVSDDNALVALAALQAHDQLLPTVADSLWLHRAKRTFEVVTTHGARRADLAGRLFLATGIERFADLSEPVARAEPGGQDPTTGSVVGESAGIDAAVTRWEVTGDRRWLDQAIVQGASALDRMTADDRLWRGPPAEVASLFRPLLRVHAAEPRPRALAELDRYLERVWREGRDPAAGRFDAGGIGRSPDRGSTLDHAAIVGLFALQARPPDG